MGILSRVSWLKADTNFSCCIGSEGRLVALHSPLSALLWTELSIGLVVSFSLKGQDFFFPPSERAQVCSIKQV